MEAEENERARIRLLLSDWRSKPCGGTRYGGSHARIGQVAGRIAWQSQSAIVLHAALVSLPSRTPEAGIPSRRNASARCRASRASRLRLDQQRYEQLHQRPLDGVAGTVRRVASLLAEESSVLDLEIGHRSHPVCRIATNRSMADVVGSRRTPRQTWITGRTAPGAGDTETVPRPER